jgi:hypothetical protein
VVSLSTSLATSFVRVSFLYHAEKAATDPVFPIFTVVGSAAGAAPDGIVGNRAGAIFYNPTNEFTGFNADGFGSGGAFSFPPSPLPPLQAPPYVSPSLTHADFHPSLSSRSGSPAPYAIDPFQAITTRGRQEKRPVVVDAYLRECVLFPSPSSLS